MSLSFEGTSTKYDYLSTYTNIGKYETKYNTSSSYAKVMPTQVFWVNFIEVGRVSTSQFTL